MLDRERNVQVCCCYRFLALVIKMVSAASISVMVPTSDSQIYFRRSGFDTYTVQSITRYPGEARPRNLIILHESLFCKNINHDFAIFKLAYDKSDS